MAQQPTLIPFVNAVIAAKELEPIEDMVNNIVGQLKGVTYTVNEANYSRDAAKTVLHKLQTCLQEAESKILEMAEGWPDEPPHDDKELGRQFENYDSGKQGRQFTYYYISDLCRKPYVGPHQLEECKQSLIDAVWLHMRLKTGVDVHKIKADNGSYVNMMKKYDREHAWKMQAVGLPTKEDGNRYNAMLRVAKHLKSVYEYQQQGNLLLHGPGAAKKKTNVASKK